MITPDSLTAALGGRYTIQREIGAGGMATVYLARDERHGREVAIKVLRADLAAILGAERFVAEVRITSQLDHPHILTLIDSGEANGLLYYVMPFVRGESLRARLDREKQLGVDEALAITRDIGSALAYAHAKGIVHRDIKPENILLHEGEAVLTDFGIAIAVKEAGGNRLTESGLSLGTPQYMSPEQATGERTLDARSDVYSLGAVLYEMLCGEPPVSGATAQAMIAKLLTERPTSLRVVRTTVSEAIDRAVLKSLEKVPADRFPSATEFVQALEVGARTTGSETNVQPRRNYRSALSIGAAAMVLLVVGAFAVSKLLNKGQRQTTTAQLGERKQVTFSGRVGVAAISDDGKTIAYTFEDCDAKGCSYGIEVEEIGAQVGRRRVLEGLKRPISIIRWSPDRRTLMFWGVLNGSPAIGLVSALGGPPTPLMASRLGNADFYGTDSIVSVDVSSVEKRGNIYISGLNGVESGRIPVVDSTDHLAVSDVLEIPGTQWFLVIVFDERTQDYSFRAVNRKGRQNSAQPNYSNFDVQWATSDALWQLTAADAASGMRALLRISFDTTAGALSAHADTLYTGTAGTFSVTRDGKNVLVSESSDTQKAWAVDMQDLLAGNLPEKSLIASSTKGVGSSVSPDGARVLIGRAAVENGLSVFVRSFTGGAEKRLQFPSTGYTLPRWIDSVTVAYWARTQSGSQFGLIDVRTGAVRDTLNVSQPVARGASTGYTSIADGGWVWKSAEDSISIQKRGDSKPTSRHAPPPLDVVGYVTATRDGKRLGIAGARRSALDSAILVIVDTDGNSPTTWLAAGLSTVPVLANAPVGYLENGTDQTTTLFRFDGPRRAHKVGSIARRVGGITLSDDLSRATLLTREPHGDAWLMRVVRR